MVPEFTLAIMAILVAAAVFYDLRERRIPNWLTMPSLGLGVVLHVIGGGSTGLVSSAVGAVIGAALLFIPFALGWMGGGDVKFLAAIGALMGVSFVLSTLLFALAAGGIMALLWLAFKRSLASSIKHIFLVWLPFQGAKPMALKTSIPFGPALGLGVLVALFWR